MSLFRHRLGAPPSPLLDDPEIRRQDDGIRVARDEVSEDYLHAIAPSNTCVLPQDFHQRKTRALAFIPHADRLIPAIVRIAKRISPTPDESLPLHTSPLSSLHPTTPHKLHKHSFPRFWQSSSSASPFHTSPSTPVETQPLLQCTLSEHTSLPRACARDTARRVDIRAQSCASEESRRTSSVSTTAGLATLLPNHPTVPFTPNPQDSSTRANVESLEEGRVLASPPDITVTSSDDFRALLDIRLWPIPRRVIDREVRQSSIAL